MTRRIAVLVVVLTVVVIAPLRAPAAVGQTEGPHVAFVSDRDGNNEVYVVAASGGTPVNLTNNAASDAAPVWSPGGSQLAFSSDRAGTPDIWLMNADGSSPINLTDSDEFELDPAWSPDGSRIAYAASLEVIQPDGSVDEVLSSSIFVMEVATGRTTRLTIPDPELPKDGGWSRGAGDRQPVWDPSGTTLAFVRRYLGGTPTAQATWVHTVPADGSESATPLAPGGWNVDGLDWGPGSDSLVWGEIGVHNTSGALRRLDVASGLSTLIDVPLDFSHYLMPALSADGATIAFSAALINRIYPDIYVWPLGGNEAPRQLTFDPASDSDPAWQPWFPSVGLVNLESGLWSLREGQSHTSFFYGNPGDVPFVGDWDCDGTATPGLFRQSDAFAYLRNTNSQGVADVRFFFGNSSDIPLAGDFNGDGCDTLSIYRPSEQRFYIINKLGENEGGLGAADYSFLFGNPGDKPVVGDWDGDGIDEVGLHRESTGFFYWRNTLDTGIADGEIFFGDPGDRFVAGDWGTIDGMDTPGLFRPSDVTFYFRYTSTQGTADSSFVWTGADSSWLPISGEFGFA